MTKPVCKMFTHSGRCVNPLKMNPEDIWLVDIAHALSNLCRYTGHLDEFFSVAEHSVLVSRLVKPCIRQHALMHDAAEAYVGDMNTHLKQAMPRFGIIERRISRLIFKRFGLKRLTRAQHTNLKTVDTRIRVNETAILFPSYKDEKMSPYQLIEIKHLSPPAAKELFIQTALEYGIYDKSIETYRK